jgi:DNA-binding response OmpR family regulator
MNRLKNTSLLLVGNPNEKQYFEEHFRDVTLLEDNNNVLEYYQKNTFSTIFLDFDSKKSDAFEICRKIREHDHTTVMVLLAYTLSEKHLHKALPLHLSGCILRPLQRRQVKEVLSNINHELEYVSEDTIIFQDDYHFHSNQKILHTPRHEEIKLTKNELKLLILLVKAKDELVSEEMIEHAIWEDDSFELDCSGRLKNLLYNLRKKLPKNSISNNYKLGYRLIHL